MNDQPRAARYIRTNASGYARTTDIARQKDVCDNVAATHGLTISETYEDICDPATPAMDRLIADAQAGKVDIVVCSSMDRLVRDAAKLTPILESLQIVSLDGDTREMFKEPHSAAVISLASRLATFDPGRPTSRG